LRRHGSTAASRCVNSSGDMTRRVLPSRQGVFSFSTTCPAALICTRSLARAGGLYSAAHVTSAALLFIAPRCHSLDCHATT
jgi:hypothetical protein